MSSTTHYNFQKVLGSSQSLRSNALINHALQRMEQGRTIKVIVKSGVTLSKGQGFYLNSSGQAGRVSGALSPVDGLWSSDSTVAGDYGYGQIEGCMELSTWSWVPGTMLYCTTGGVVSAVRAGRPIAVAVTPTVVLLKPWLGAVWNTIYNIHKPDIEDITEALNSIITVLRSCGFIQV